MKLTDTYTIQVTLECLDESGKDIHISRYDRYLVQDLLALGVKHQEDIVSAMSEKLYEEYEKNEELIGVFNEPYVNCFLYKYGDKNDKDSSYFNGFSPVLRGLYRRGM